MFLGGVASVIPDVGRNTGLKVFCSLEMPNPYWGAASRCKALELGFTIVENASLQGHLALDLMAYTRVARESSPKKVPRQDDGSLFLCVLRTSVVTMGASCHDLS
jgi:hypothetical protein